MTSYPTQLPTPRPGESRRSVVASGRAVGSLALASRPVVGVADARHPGHATAHAAGRAMAWGTQRTNGASFVGMGKVVGGKNDSVRGLFIDEITGRPR